MAVGFDAASESHTGTAGSTGGTFSWTHTPGGTPKGVLVFTFANGSTDDATGVTYGGLSLNAVAGGRAVDTAGEPGDCKAWLLSTRNSVRPGGDWPAVASSGFSTAVDGMAYGSGYWVGVAASGSLRYATDPVGTWTAASSPGFGTTNLHGVAYGDGYWVAVGDGGSLRYATDPTGTWTAASSPGFGTTIIRAVAYGNGYWVAVGDAGSVRYATDPTGTWSAPSSPGFSTGFPVSDVVYKNGYWAATGYGISAVRYTTDPTGTWSAPAALGTINQARAIDYGGNYWVVVADGGVIRYTTDITGTWTAASAPGFGINNVVGVAYGDGYWVATSNTSTAVPPLRFTTDPSGTWSGVRSADFNANVYSIVFDNLTWLAGSKEIYYGADGMVALPTGPQSVVVTRVNTNEMYAVAITVTADYGVEAAGVSAVSADASGGTASLAGTSVNDGSPGTKSMRFAGVNSGLSAPPTVNSGTTAVADIDYGTRVVAVARETSASEGSTSIGWTAAADDVAAVYLAVREAIIPWTIGVPTR